MSETEITACRAIADRCVFIVGFGRSGTTINQQLLNTHPGVLVLGEANFYIPAPDRPRFSDWYNAMHEGFGNAPDKSTRAQDYLSGPHAWFDWLTEAAKRYELVGDKMALSDFHFKQASPDQMLAFFAERFPTSRYIFTMRDPVQTLLSLARLLSQTTDEHVTKEIDAWLRYILMWLDFRNQLNTITVFSEDFGPATAETLSKFLGVDLKGSHLFGSQNAHPARPEFVTLDQFSWALSDLYKAIKDGHDDSIIRKLVTDLQSSIHDAHHHWLARYQFQEQNDSLLQIKTAIGREH